MNLASVLYFPFLHQILNLEGVTSELQVERDRLVRELQSAEARLQVGEKSGRHLTEEYASLKKKHLALAEAHNKQVAQGEELSAELLALARAQDALRRQLHEQQQNVKTTTQGLYGELDRVQALIGRMSHDRVQVSLWTYSPTANTSERWVRHEQNMLTFFQTTELNHPTSAS